jgi:hypothetical protein
MTEQLNAAGGVCVAVCAGGFVAGYAGYAIAYLFTSCPFEDKLREQSLAVSLAGSDVGSCKLNMKVVICSRPKVLVSDLVSDL